MPSEPLADLASFDLDNFVAPIEEVRKICKQRGSFEMLDGIVHYDMEEGLIIASKQLTTDASWAADHIPGRPIFPGVLMIEASAQMCTYDFIHRRPDLENAFVGFAGVDSTRFRGLVEPPSRMIWIGRPDRLRKTMFTYNTQGFVDGRMVFEAKIMGVVV